MPYINKSKNNYEDLADQKGRVKFSDIKKKGKHKRAKSKSINK